jgi:hypothetical protein
MRNCVRQNHTTLQLKLKNNLYIIVMQLSLQKHDVLIPHLKIS